MLRVTTLHASSAAATAAYYAQYLTDAPGEVPGVWSGGQADGFGLAGDVTVEQLEWLLSGRDPISGTLLGRELVDRYTVRWSGGAGGVGVRRHVLGAEVAECVVGVDR